MQTKGSKGRDFEDALQGALPAIAGLRPGWRHGVYSFVEAGRSCQASVSCESVVRRLKKKSRHNPQHFVKQVTCVSWHVITSRARVHVAAAARREAEPHSALRRDRQKVKQNGCSLPLTCHPLAQQRHAHVRQFVALVAVITLDGSSRRKRGTTARDCSSLVENTAVQP